MLQPFQHRISWRILPILPAPTLLDEFLIQVHAIGQDHLANGALILVVAVRLNGDFFPKGKGRGGVLGALTERLAFLRAIDAVEADTFRLLVVQDFDGVAVEDGDDLAGESVGALRNGDAYNQNQENEQGVQAERAQVGLFSFSEGFRDDQNFSSTTPSFL